MTVSRPLLIVGLAIACTGCPDAKPGHSGAGGSSSSNGSGGAGGSGAMPPGNAPNFAEATATQLYSPDAASGSFAETVAISGDTVLVGAPHELTSLISTGAVHVFRHSGTEWSPEARLSPPELADGDFYGIGIAIDGDLAWIGADGHSTPQDLGGAAFALGRNGQSWISQTKHQLPAPEALTRFGRAVAISGSTAVVGAPYSVGHPGAAFVFEREGQDWSYSTELIAEEATDTFGRALDIDGDTVLVGSPGSQTAYVFVRDNGSWMQQGKLVPATGTVADYGIAVSLSGDTAVVGCDPTSQEGAAYVFVRSNGSWQQQQELKASDGSSGNRFGFALALDGNALLVGAPHDEALGVESGAAYVFARTGGSWTEQTKLQRPNGGEEEEFGISVALDGKLAVVGTAGFLHASNPTSAIVFTAP